MKEMTIEKLAEMVSVGFADMARKTDIEGLRTEMREGFAAVDKEFDEVYERFDEVYRRLDRIEKQVLDQHDNRITRLELELKDLRQTLKV